MKILEHIINDNGAVYLKIKMTGPKSYDSDRGHSLDLSRYFKHICSVCFPFNIDQRFHVTAEFPSQSMRIANRQWGAVVVFWFYYGIYYGSQLCGIGLEISETTSSRSSGQVQYYSLGHVENTTDLSSYGFECEIIGEQI